jgi:hypothetical protein
MSLASRAVNALRYGEEKSDETIRKPHRHLDRFARRVMTPGVDTPAKLW